MAWRLPPDHYTSASVTDRVFELLADRAPPELHLAIDLRGDVDPVALREAWARIPGRHPILGASLRGSRWWLGRGQPPSVHALREAGQAAAGPGPIEAAMLDQRLSARRGPLCRLTIVDRGAETRLLLSTHHAAMDARALLEVAVLLRDGVLRHPIGGQPPDYRARTIGEVARSHFDEVERYGVGDDALEAIVERGARRWNVLPASTHRGPDDERGPEPVSLLAAALIGLRLWWGRAELLATIGAGSRPTAAR